MWFEQASGRVPVRKWRVHLGAHKTASSHIQEVLLLLRESQLERGVDVLPHRPVRESGLASALVARRSQLVARLPLPRLRALETRRIVDRYVAPLRRGPDTVVLSEEKLLGDTQHIFSEPPYPAIEKVVPLLAALGRAADLTLFFTVRAFDRHLPSAYAQELRFRPPGPGGFEAIRKRVIARPPSWYEMVRRIRACAPGVPLRVWRYEDYRDNARTILSLLCGNDVGPIPKVEDPFWTASPGIEAIREAEQLSTDLGPAERRLRVLDIWKNADPRSPRFLPFAPDEVAMLRAAYERDLERIHALDPSILVRF